ncbi:MAG: DciA family protein [Thiolinea sp.]
MKKVNRLIANPFITERLDQIDQVTRCLENFLGLPLNNRVWPLLRRSQLVLMTDDPHLATQARFLQRALCKHLNQQLSLNVSGLDIKLVGLPLTRNSKKLRRVKHDGRNSGYPDSIAASIEDQDSRSKACSVWPARHNNQSLLRRRPANSDRKKSHDGVFFFIQGHHFPSNRAAAVTP